MGITENKAHRGLREAGGGHDGLEEGHYRPLLESKQCECCVGGKIKPSKQNECFMRDKIHYNDYYKVNSLNIS